MFKSTEKKDLLVIVDGNHIDIQKVYKVDAESIETDEALVVNNNENIKTYVNRSGGIVYVSNLDLPAKMEAENLKKLRRSTALKQVFQFERGSNGFDIMKFMPYIIILLLILF